MIKKILETLKDESIYIIAQAALFIILMLMIIFTIAIAGTIWMEP